MHFCPASVFLTDFHQSLHIQKKPSGYLITGEYQFPQHCPAGWVGVDELWLTGARIYILNFSGGSASVFSFLIWRPPTLPHRLQCSTIGRSGLNRRVRDGYGCSP